jgi:type II secretory pathway component PulF
LTRAFETGEETGRLDDEMERLGNRYDEQLKDRLAALASWIPQIVYVGIALYIGWRIVTFAVGYFGQINSLMDNL